MPPLGQTWYVRQVKAGGIQEQDIFRTLIKEKCASQATKTNK